MDELLSAKDLERILSLNRKLIYRLIAEGQIPRPLRVGKSFRWRRRDIEMWQFLDCPPADKFEQMHEAALRIFEMSFLARDGCTK